MIHPPPLIYGGICINLEDYACLGDDQFLNDVIIDFYLQYLVQNILSEEDRKRTHVLSSFFYKRLISKMDKTEFKANKGSNISSAEKRHTRVKGWTKNVNIFGKDFIIIPINENSHWFLVIICFPGLQSVVRMSDNQSIDDTGRWCNISNKSTSEGGEIPPTTGETTITEESKEGGDNNGDLMKEEEFPKPEKALSGNPPIKQACILVFDSLKGESRSRVIANLREYLHVEYQMKHNGATKNFTKNFVKGSVPNVPQQNNFTDCGLYVLQYVEEFFRNPLTDFRMPLKLQNWFDPEVVSRKRYEIQQLLHKLMDDQGVDRERINLPRLNLQPDGRRYSQEEGKKEEEGIEQGVDEGLEGEEEPFNEDMDVAMMQVTPPLQQSRHLQSCPPSSRLATGLRRQPHRRSVRVTLMSLTRSSLYRRGRSSPRSKLVISRKKM